jgi:hypothetical protein
MAAEIWCRGLAWRQQFRLDLDRCYSTARVESLMGRVPVSLFVWRRRPVTKHAPIAVEESRQRLFIDSLGIMVTAGGFGLARGKCGRL